MIASLSLYASIWMQPASPNLHVSLELIAENFRLRIFFVSKIPDFVLQGQLYGQQRATNCQRLHNAALICRNKLFLFPSKSRKIDLRDFRSPTDFPESASYFSWFQPPRAQTRWRPRWKKRDSSDQQWKKYGCHLYSYNHRLKLWWKYFWATRDFWKIFKKYSVSVGKN